jgi:translation initiation factor IF-3
MFRGREMAHPDIGRDLLLQLADQVGSVAVVEQAPHLEGRNMTMLLGPRKAQSSSAQSAPNAARPAPAPAPAPAPLPE